VFGEISFERFEVGVCKTFEGLKPEVPKLIWTTRQQGHAATHLSLREFSSRKFLMFSHSKVPKLPKSRRFEVDLNRRFEEGRSDPSI
jgi:hypothetical protein